MSSWFISSFPSHNAFSLATASPAPTKTIANSVPPKRPTTSAFPRCQHHVGQMLDHGVADRMAMAVIDILQADTNKQKRVLSTMLTRQHLRMRELAHKSTPIERLRQFVVIGKVRDKRDTFCGWRVSSWLSCLISLINCIMAIRAFSVRSS